MNFRLGHNATTYNILIVVFLVLLAGIAAFDYFVPKPEKISAVRTAETKKAKLESELRGVKLELEAAEQMLVSRSWSGSLETVSPKVLEQTSKLAGQAGFNLTAFRPQRPVENQTLDQVTFNVIGDAPFPKVMAFIRLLDSQMPKGAVTQVQMASNDGAKDTVNATIGLTVYLERPRPATTTATTGRLSGG